MSTYPLASQALSRLRLAGATSRAPVVTFLTDMGVHPLWVAPGVDAHLALHEVPAGQARELGGRGVEVAGPVVPPTFRPRSSTQRQDIRRDFALPCDRRLALVVAGLWGVGDITRTGTTSSPPASSCRWWSAGPTGGCSRACSTEPTSLPWDGWQTWPP